MFTPGYFENLKTIPVNFGLIATVIFGVLDTVMVYASGFITDVMEESLY